MPQRCAWLTLVVVFTLGRVSSAAPADVAPADAAPAEEPPIEALPELELVPPAPPPETSAALASPPQELTTRGRVGVGIAAAGVATAIVGGVFGVLHLARRDDVRTGVGGTPQPEAKRVYADANRYASNANVAYLSGAVLLLVGGALVGWDLVATW